MKKVVILGFSLGCLHMAQAHHKTTSRLIRFSKPQVGVSAEQVLLPPKVSSQSAKKPLKIN